MWLRMACYCCSLVIVLWNVDRLDAVLQISSSQRVEGTWYYSVLHRFTWFYTVLHCVYNVLHLVFLVFMSSLAPERPRSL